MALAYYTMNVLGPALPPMPVITISGYVVTYDIILVPAMDSDYDITGIMMYI